MIRKAPWTKEDQILLIKYMIQALGSLVVNLDNDSVELQEVDMKTNAALPFCGPDELHLTFEVVWARKREDG